MRRVALWVSLGAVAMLGLLPSVAAAAPVPAPRGGLDCNGFSPLQQTFRHLWCTEIAANDEQGFEDNGHYVGHDEPDIGFFAFRRGSATQMTYKTVLPLDPAEPASPAFGGSTHEFELTPAIWFGLTLCDNESYPEGTKV